MLIDSGCTNAFDYVTIFVFATFRPTNASVVHCLNRILRILESKSVTNLRLNEARELFIQGQDTNRRIWHKYNTILNKIKTKLKNLNRKRQLLVLDKVKPNKFKNVFAQALFNKQPTKHWQKRYLGKESCQDVRKISFVVSDLLIQFRMSFE